MTERDLTRSNGPLAVELKKIGYAWERIPDNGRRTNSVGYDGLIVCKDWMAFCEVKMGWKSLEPSEDRAWRRWKTWLVPYIVLRYFDTHWAVFLWDTDVGKTGTLEDCIRWVREKTRWGNGCSPTVP